MDGHFVPNITMGVPLVRGLAAATGLPLDVHLMVANPLVQIPWFLAAGAGWLTVHIEALEASAGQAEKAVALIREAGAHPCLAVRPDTPLAALKPYLRLLDMVLVMSVQPGFSGQAFMEGSLARVASLARTIAALPAPPLIEVDGGIDAGNIQAVVGAGADVVVAGNAVFAAPDPRSALASLCALARAAGKGDDASC